MKALIYTLLTALVLSMFAACTTESKEPEPTAVDESLKSSKLPRKYGDMLRAIAQNPSDHKKNGLYINEVASYYLETGATTKAIETLKRGIINHKPSNNTSSNILLLLDALKSDPSKKQDYINLAQSLAIGYPSLNGLEKYTSDIPQGEPKMKDKIAEIQKNLTNTSTGRLDLPKVNEFVNAIEFFVIGNPTNESSVG